MALLNSLGTCLGKGGWAKKAEGLKFAIDGIPVFFLNLLRFLHELFSVCSRPEITSLPVLAADWSI